MVSRLQIIQTLDKKKISVTFSANTITHMLSIIKKKIHPPNKPENQENNFDVISNVMTFLTLHVKV